MKKNLLCALLAAVTLNAAAYDFTDGVLCYNVLESGTDVEVTYDVPENSSYSGVIHIPATAEYNGKVYNVTAIGEKAFYHSGVTDIHISSTIKTIGKYAFQFSSELRNVTLPQGLQTLPDYAFSSTDIVSLALPEGLTSIGPGAFQSCINLSTLFFPEQLSRISNNGICACSNMKEIYCLAATPPDATAFAIFNGIEELDVIVPDNSVDTYSSTEPWNKFSIYPSEEFTMTMTIQGVNKGDYDEISLGDAKAYRIKYGDELIAVTAADTYYLPNDGSPKTYTVIPTNYFYDDAPLSYTTKPTGSVDGVGSDSEAVKIYATNGTVYLDGDVAGKKVEVYDVYGNLYHSSLSANYIGNLPSGKVYIVRCESIIKKVVL